MTSRSSSRSLPVSSCASCLAITSAMGGTFSLEDEHLVFAVGGDLRVDEHEGCLAARLEPVQHTRRQESFAGSVLAHRRSGRAWSEGAKRRDEASREACVVLEQAELDGERTGRGRVKEGAVVVDEEKCLTPVLHADVASAPTVPVAGEV